MWQGPLFQEHSGLDCLLGPLKEMALIDKSCSNGKRNSYALQSLYNYFVHYALSYWHHCLRVHLTVMKIEENFITATNCSL